MQRTAGPPPSGSPVRYGAEMARQKKTTAALAQALGIGAHTAGRRVSGEIPFDVLELAVVAHWLSVPLERLVGGTQEAA